MLLHASVALGASWPPFILVISRAALWGSFWGHGVGSHHCAGKERETRGLNNGRIGDPHGQRPRGMMAGAASTGWAH